MPLGARREEANQEVIATMTVKHPTSEKERLAMAFTYTSSKPYYRVGELSRISSE
jgi:hypothetical protein